MQTYFIIAVISYLLGSIPFGYLLVKIFLKSDIRTSGSGNIGATNVARKAPGLGIATLILDAAKGYLAVYFVQNATPSDDLTTRFPFFRESFSELNTGFLHWSDSYATALVLAALFAILGHVFPVWLKFKGGKGVATGVGAFVAFAPRAVLLVIVIFAILVAISRYVSLGSIVAAAAFPFAVWLLQLPFPPVAYLLMFAASGLIILKHHENIRRLLSGTENRLGQKKKEAQA